MNIKDSSKIEMLSDGVCCYSRNSTELGAKASSELFNAFYKEHNKRIINEYIELDYIVNKTSKPELSKLLNNENDCDIIVKNFSTLSKNIEEFNYIVNKIKEKNQKTWSFNL